MSFWRDWERYYNYKLIRAIDELWTLRREQKRREKARKKAAIKKNGYLYYINDKTWLKIKDMRSYENYRQWRNRLKSYGFTTDGVYITTGEKHNAEPKGHR